MRIVLSIIFFSLLAALYWVGLSIPSIITEDNGSLIIQENKFVLFKFFEEKKEELISQKADFIEVNLDKMRVRIYRQGLAKKEIPILTKGDPQGWGGSAVGLYQIMSGNKLSFSIISDVYMPYALRYYGKYYLHGQPYYPGGEKLISDVSGGCLRLEDKDAKMLYNLAEINMPIIVIDKERDFYHYHSVTTEFPHLSAQSYVVADLDSGFLFAEKDFQEQFPIASLTKLMTALVVAENKDLSKHAWVTEEMLGTQGSTEKLEEGQKFRIVELFYPLLIESSNDAAEVLSYSLGKKRTIRLMNEKAESILMEKTLFVDPSGLSPDNISTAKDLFHLARYLLNNRPPILAITKGEKVITFGKISFDIEDLWNKNIFINDSTFVGGKTGFIKEAHNTALFIFRLTTGDGVERNIVITLLGSNDIQADTHKAYGWLLKNYFQEL